MSTFKRIIVENHYKKNTTQQRICFRSGWEVSFANFLDTNTNVASWESEFRIKYIDKFNSPPKPRIYLIDFKVQMIDGATLLIEVKPLKSLESVRVNTNSFRYKRIHATNLLKNYAKFETAELFCRKIGWRFFLAQKEPPNFRFYRWSIEHKRPIPI
jgi:hypothetical protein